MFTIKRSPQNPIISPTKNHPWEASATFNWCPVRENNKKKSNIYAVYRAVSEKELLKEPHIQLSIIAKAVSKDGENFDQRMPFIIPEEDYEKYGCEDPRVTKLDNTYYIFYTAISTFPFSPDGIKLAVALSKDMETIQEKHLVTPFNAKAMVLFPEKINGKMVAILTVNTDRPPSRIAFVEFDEKEDMWSEKFWNNWYKNLDSHIINLQRSPDNQIEVGAPPIKTEYGWLVIYSQISHYGANATFGIEAVLLDLKDPRKIIGKTKGAFMVAEEYYEVTGLVPNIVFPSGALVEDGILHIYYGASDTHCAKASLPIENLIKSMLPNSRKKFIRFEGNPIITPRVEKDWEEGGTFNPGVIELDKKIHIIYRATTKNNLSVFGYAISKDGFIIDERLEKPIYSARTDFEGVGKTENSGCEDPRVVEIDNVLYMAYTAYDGQTPRVAISSIQTKDFLKRKFDKWSVPQIISPLNVPNKDACIIPEKINGKYYIFHRIGTTVCVDTVNSLDFSTEKIIKCIEIILPRKGMWDERKVGIASPLIKTKIGWILLYHGISETGTYRVGAVLLDLKDPTIIKARTAIPIFEPEEDYELKGTVSKVVFPCGVTIRKGLLYLYYGGADYSVSVATIKLSTLLKMFL